MAVFLGIYKDGNMKIVLRDNISLYLEDITDDEVNIIFEAFTFENENAYAQQNSSSYRPWQNKILKFNRVKRTMSRTFLGRLVHFCTTRGLPFHIEDKRPKWEYSHVDPKSVDENFLPGIKLEDYQIDAIKTGIKCECGLFSLTTGAGKCLGKDVPVMMYDGSSKMSQDIQVGDLLMGDDSRPRRVLSVCQGRENLYRIDQIYGDSYVVNESHILSLSKSPRNKYETHQKIDISITDYLNSSKGDKHRLKGYKVPVDYPSKSVELDPYFLGLWLGDGISADTSFCLHEFDSAEVVDALHHYAASMNCTIHLYNEQSKANNYAIRLYEGIHAPIDYVAHTQNPFRAGLKRYGLLRNKHIPSDYIYNSREVRLQLLAGLIDSDGEMSHNCYFVNLKNESIVRSACIIARSLGFRSKVRPNIKKSQTGHVGQYWSLSISGHTDVIPVKIGYKKSLPRKIKKNPLVSGITVTELGEGDYYGFEIDGNKRFLLSDFTVTHNTELIAGLCKAISCPTLILADMTIVVSQLKERLELREVASEIGMFFAGKKPNGEMIIVGSIQSLTMPKPPRERPERSEYDDDKKHAAAIKRWEASVLGYQTRKKNHKMLMEYVRKAEMLIVDECDRSAGPSYREVIRKQFKGRRKYGFSGTVFDDSKPIANLNIEENFGYIICEKGRREVEEKGRIVPIKYRMIHYSDPEYHFRNKITVEDAIKLFMVDNVKLHTMIYAILKAHKNEKNMILVDRIELGEAINDFLNSAGLNSRFIYGTTPKKERKTILDDFAAGNLDVMIGGKIVNRGLDIKGGVDNLIMATTGKLRSEFLQKIGRAVRVNERGYSYVYGFLMRCNHYLFEHSKAALNTIISAGYESEVNFGYAVITGEELVDRKFLPPPINKKNKNQKQKELF